MMQRGDDEWRRNVYSTIGGSSAAAVLKQARFMTLGKLFTRMRSAMSGEALWPDARGPDVDRGHLFEPLIMGLLQDRLQKQLQPHGQCEFMRNEKYPFAHVLPDVWIEVGKHVADVKCPRPATCTKVRLVGIFAEWHCQAQHTMAVTETNRFTIAMFDPVQVILDVIEVQRDEGFIAQLLDAEAKFYEAVQRNEPPEPAEAEETYETPRTFPVLRGADDRRAMEHYLRVRDLLGETEDVMVLAKDRVKGLCDAPYFEVHGVNHTLEDGRFQNVARVHHKSRAGSRSLNREAVIQAFPDVEKGGKFWKVSKPSRPLSVYTRVTQAPGGAS